MSANSENILEIKHIEVVYDNVILALHDVSLNVPRGKIVALLGANGAGKSTTLKSISNMLILERGEVTKGSIQYNGTVIAKQHPTDLVHLGILSDTSCSAKMTLSYTTSMCLISSIFSELALIRIPKTFFSIEIVKKGGG